MKNKKYYIFDMDGTVTEETEFIIKVGPKFIKEKLGVIVSDLDKEAYGLAGIFRLEKVFRDLGTPEENLEETIKTFQKKFWNTNFPLYMTTRFKPESSRTINRLFFSGNRVEFLTLRGVKTKENEKFKHKIIRKVVVPLLTRFQLARNLTFYHKLTLVTTEEEKIEYLKKYKPDYVFEDSVSIINLVQTEVPEVKPICVKQGYNKEVTVTTISGYENGEALECLETLNNANEILTETQNIGHKISKLKIYNTPPEKGTLKTGLKAKGKINKLKKLVRYILGKNKNEKKEVESFEYTKK